MDQYDGRTRTLILVVELDRHGALIPNSDESHDLFLSVVRVRTVAPKRWPGLSRALPRHQVPASGGRFASVEVPYLFAVNHRVGT